ncbi:MAG: hypothetical protein ACOX20_05125 [Limnochordia bacterium]
MAGLAGELARAGAELTVLSGDPGKGQGRSTAVPAVHRLSLAALAALREL